MYKNVAELNQCTMCYCRYWESMIDIYTNLLYPDSIQNRYPKKSL